jgi:hypothetical protein
MTRFIVLTDPIAMTGAEQELKNYPPAKFRIARHPRSNPRV